MQNEQPMPDARFELLQLEPNLGLSIKGSNAMHSGLGSLHKDDMFLYLDGTGCFRLGQVICFASGPKPLSAEMFYFVRCRPYNQIRAGVWAAARTSLFFMPIDKLVAVVPCYKLDGGNSVWPFFPWM